jgi:hypothetical protein
MVEALEKYKTAMDALYNHNSATRAAVVQHFGTLHPIAALASVKEKAFGHKKAAAPFPESG